MAETPPNMKLPKKRSEFYLKTVNSFTNPTKFFDLVQKEKFYKTVLYFALFSLFYLLMLAITFLLISNFLFGALFSLLGLEVPTSLIITGVFTLWLVSLVGSFIISGILHIFVMLLGGKSFQNTYKAFAYSYFPNFLLGWIPLVGLLFLIWAWYLNIRGFSTLHKMSIARATLVLVVPVIIFGLLACLISFFAVLYMINSWTPPATLY